MFRKFSPGIAMLGVLALVMAIAPAARADNVQNNAQAAGNSTITVGGSTTINYYIQATNQDGQNNTGSPVCNASDGSAATVAIVTPAGVTATPSSLVFSLCGTTNSNTKAVVFSSNTAGSYPISATVSDAGVGTYDVTGAAFTLQVNAPVVTDSTPPVITPTVTGTLGSNGWYTSDVDVTWSVVDGQSEVTSTSNCQLTSLTSETTGQTVTCSATSAGGTSSQSVSIKMDKSGPSATLTPSGTAGLNGWYVSDVTVTTTGSDAISGPVSCSSPQTITATSTATGSCTNAAGLTTNATVLPLKIAKSGPSATLVVTAGVEGDNGWYTSDVTVSTESDDPGANCTADQFQSTETDGTIFNGSCTNEAGLKTDAAPLTVKLDKTAPTSVELAVVAGTEGDNGWYTSDVTVRTTGVESLSGPVTCTDDQSQATETTGAVFNGSCTNEAGLTANASPLTVKVDKTGPSAQLAVVSGTEGLNGWYTSNVTVRTSGSDAVSGPVTCTGDQSQATETTGAVFNGSCTNEAGLITNADPLTVKLDKTGPSATLAVSAGTLGSNGWYVSDVTVRTSGADSTSGPVVCTDDQQQTEDTSGIQFTGGCVNDAGLETTAAPLTVKLDKSDPTLSWVGGPADGGSYYFGSVPAAATCVAADVTSGPEGCVVSGYSSTVGSHTMTATATDLAGNTYAEERTYTVLAWSLGGYFQPVDMPSALNTVKNGSTVPLKFRVFAGATELTATSVVKSFRQTKVGCSAFDGAPLDDIEVTTTGGTTLRYDATGGQFIQNWQTPKAQGACYIVTMTTQDGSSISADFRLK